MATPEMIHLPDGSDIPSNDVICKDCEESLAHHRCNGASGGGSVTFTSPTRSTGPRKAPTTRPPCAHCNGAIHFSMPGGLQNTECIMRQFYLDKGEIKTPYDRLPLFGIDDLANAIEWARSLATPITYGRMLTAAGGSGTYSSLRPKTGRKKKTVPAAPGAQIQDMAEEEAAAATSEPGEGDLEATTETPKKRRGRKAKTTTPTNGTVSKAKPKARAKAEAPVPDEVDEIEDIDDSAFDLSTGAGGNYAPLMEDEPDEEPEDEPEDEEEEEAPAPQLSPLEQARLERQARRAQRKAAAAAVLSRR